MHALLVALEKVEQLAKASKLTRFLAHPFRYGQAILFRELIYPRRRRAAYRTSITFFGAPLTVALPAGTDIYLTGGKTHDSEIRLARYFIHNLLPGEHLLDIGAHFGYFTLLAAYLVGKTGQVQSFEASAINFQLLKQNTVHWPQVKSWHRAVSDEEGTLTFYQFPVQFSEYNSRNITQYQHEAWFQKYTPEAITVPAVTIEAVCNSSVFRPKIIKIDVEGGELQVIKGGAKTLQQQSPAVIMEYLAPSRNNQVHRQACELLLQWGYAAHTITPDGSLLACANPDLYLKDQHLDSDNLVFKKIAPAANHPG